MLEKFNLIDLKIMNNDELVSLSKEIRDKIIRTVSNNGGHLSSNLGIVELTVALHKVFDSPHDKIIFDVSHQTYAHKILTGRFNKFDTLRQYGGISGFASYNESTHDVFEAGHSSTSISAGLGFLEAKKSNPDAIGNVIAVIGDASVSNGLAFEALNYLGDHPEQKMIIIINDNTMSVSKNVGALAKSYNKLRTNSSMKFLKKITPVKVKNALQYYAYKVELFTSLGLKYFENIDGHNFDELLRYLEYAKNYPKSIVLHIKTKKGCGYPLAETDTVGMWHKVGKFDIETGYFLDKNKGISFGDALESGLETLAGKDPNNKIRVIAAAMSLNCGIDNFKHLYPEKYIDVGIAEENAVVMASAMAKNGLVPITFIYSTFIQRAYDELIHDIARPGAHAVFCLDRAGIVSGDGSTHQGIYDLAMLNSIPGIVILSPVTPVDAIKMLDYAVNKINQPVVIRYPAYHSESDKLYFSGSMKWTTVRKTSNDTFVVAYGPVVEDIQKLIKENGYGSGLIAATTINPVDGELLKALSAMRAKLIVYEDVIQSGGLYSRILEYVADNKLFVSVERVGLPNTYLPVGTIQDIKKKYRITLNDLGKVLEAL